MVRLIPALFFLIILWPLRVDGAPRVSEGFSIEPLLKVGDLLSGITSDERGVVVCEYDLGRILRITLESTIEVLAENLQTPVDVEYVEGALWVLLEQPGQIISIDPASGDRRTIIESLEGPTAFARGKNQELYVIEYLEGCLLEVDSESKEIRVLRDDLDGPADIAILPGGDIMIAEQVGLDFIEGRLTRISPDGRIVSRTPLPDATGLAVGPDGTLFISTFSIGEAHHSPRSWGGIVSLRNGQLRIVAQGLIGPTSLTVLPDGRLAVIEETTNSIFLVDRNGSTRPLIRGFSAPEAIGVFPDGDIAVLEGFPSAKISFVRDGTVGEPIWSMDSLPAFPPTMAQGNDGLLYVLDPLMGVLHVLRRSGEPAARFQVSFVRYLASDPFGGVALLTPGALVRVGPEGIIDSSPVHAGNAFGFFIRGNGHAVIVDENLAEVEEIGRYRTTGVAHCGMGEGQGSDRCLFTTSSGKDLWFAFQGDNTLFLKREGTDQTVMEGLEGIVALAAGADDSVVVGTSRGGLYRVSVKTSVVDWRLY
ncbi:MAG: hypothetical protein ABIH23_02490 [bacterium]